MSFLNFKTNKTCQAYESIQNLPEDEFFNRELTLMDLFAEAIDRSQITASNGDSSFLIPGTRALNLGAHIEHLFMATDKLGDYRQKRQELSALATKEQDEMRLNAAIFLRNQFSNISKKLKDNKQTAEEMVNIQNLGITIRARLNLKNHVRKIGFKNSEPGLLLMVGAAIRIFISRSTADQNSIRSNFGI